VLLTLAILGLPTVVYAWGRSSSSFDIRTVEVAGTRLVPQKKALRLLRQDYAGSNLFTVTGGDVRKTLASLVFVSGASVDRDFPDTLAVTIAEYEPAAYALAGGRWYVIDGSGYVICTAAEAADQLAKGRGSQPSPKPSAWAGAESPEGPPAAEESAAAAADVASADAEAQDDAGSLTERLVAGPEKASLPLPRLAVSGRVRRGDVVSDKAAVEVLAVVAALPRSLQRRLAAVQNDDGQLTLRFAGGPVTTWGDSQRMLAKTVALRTVLKEYEKADKICTELDVSLPDRTLAKPVLQ
jgi:cell division septal protein FtsQ